MADDERSGLEQRLIELSESFMAWYADGEPKDFTPELGLILSEAADALAECRLALADQVSRCVSCAGSGTIPPPDDVEAVELVQLPCTRCETARAALTTLETRQLLEDKQR